MYCATLSSEGQGSDPNIVKVVCNKNGQALYFSRSMIPYRGNKGDRNLLLRHIGIYAYRTGFLKMYTDLPPCDLEKIEKLEQLRALYHGHSIQVEVCEDKLGIGVDTEADLEKARLINKQLSDRE